MKQLWLLLGIYFLLSVFSMSALAGEKLIGEWTDKSSYGSKYTLIENNGKILMIIKFSAGGSTEKEMIQTKQREKLRFEEKGGNKSGEYFLIEEDGQLVYYDHIGLAQLIPRDR